MNYLESRRSRLFWRDFGPLGISMFLVLLVYLFGMYFGWLIFRCQPVMIDPSPTQKQAKVVLASLPKPATISGLASYYSLAGCIGCREDRLMANGQRLDDSRVTVAYNRAPLNSKLKIKNVKTGKMVTALVTDRGGFERHGKIIDLSVATKNALGCGDVCRIEIYD